MNTVKQGNKFEDISYQIIKDSLNSSELGLIPEQCKIYQKKGYYSKDRNKNIIFDLCIEVWPPKAKRFSLLYLIECKDYRSRPIPVDDIEEFYAKVTQVSGVNVKAVYINYICANYLDYEPSHKFDLVTMIMCDYCALSPKRRKLMLDKFKKLLKPGGSILLDVYSLNAFNDREEKAVYEFNQLSKFWSDEDYFSFHNTFKYEKEKVILDKYTIIEKSRKRIVYNWLQYFSLDSLRKEFEENGFTIVEAYSDVTGSEYKNDSLEFAVVGESK